MPYTLDNEYVEALRPEDWPLPDPAPRWMRIPVIRHIRWAYHLRRVHDHQYLWGSLGYAANEYDERCLTAIWRGEI